MISPYELQSALTKAVEHLQHELGSLQIGRASTILVEDIQAESYGSMMPLKTMANITCPDSQTVRVEPWDKTNIGPIEKAILEANIGITPQNMGEHILLPIPPMTEDRRRDIVKKVHDLAEHARIAVRNNRQEAMKFVKLQKDEKEISEDEAKKEEKSIQEATDKANKEIDTISKTKEEDILKV